MTNDNPEIVSWWTPQGWVQMPAPAEYAAYEAAAKGAVEDFGYGKIQQFGDWEITDFEVSLYRVAGHWLVDVWNMDCRISAVFIEKRYFTPFLIDRLPRLLNDLGLIGHPSELSRISKALIAFIRHGHGERTIDQHGGWTLDDTRADDADFRKRAAKSAGGGKP